MQIEEDDNIRTNNRIMGWVYSSNIHNAAHPIMQCALGKQNKTFFKWNPFQILNTLF